MGTFKKQIDLRIKQLEEADIAGLATSFQASGLNKTVDIFNQYFDEQTKDQRLIWIAQVDGKYAGYITLVWHSPYKSFAKKNIPEIKDLNVLPEHRKQGVGTALLLTAEKCAFEHCTQVGIGVGLYKDYGDAQKLYYSMGYVPDGNGVTYDYENIKPGKMVCLDDDLCLWFIKSLTS